MNPIVALIDIELPVVFEGNWPSLRALGWCWYKNYLLTDESFVVRSTKEAQQEYGRNNVTTGCPFHSDLMEPKYDPSGFVVGLYVRHNIDLLLVGLNDLFNIDPKEWPIVNGI